MADPPVDPPSNPALNRIWADGTPLSKFIEDRAQQLSRQTPAAAWMTISAPGESPSLGERFAAGLESYKDLLAARDKARADTINDLVAGRLVGLGRPSGAPKLEEIEALFWIGAEFLSGNSVKSGRRKMSHVHIVPSETIASVQPKPQSGPGRPSEADVIREAIVDYAKRDPRLRRPPSERYEAYRQYAARRGSDPSGQGFDEKTFQKYETAFRKGSFK